MAASAVEAGDNFFNTDSTATGSVADNQASPAAPIIRRDNLDRRRGDGFADLEFCQRRHTITVNGKTITFSTSAATSTNANGGTINCPPDGAGRALGDRPDHGHLHAIDRQRRRSHAAYRRCLEFSITTSNATALNALGFSGGSVSALQPPLRVGGTPLGSATSLVSGASDTVQWYTGNSGPGSALASSTAQIDTSETVQYGMQANEQADPDATAEHCSFCCLHDVADRNQFRPTDRGAGPERGGKSDTDRQSAKRSDIQTNLANAQTQIQAATARQTQIQSLAQNLIASTEQVSEDQVSSELLAVQNSFVGILRGDLNAL